MGQGIEKRWLFIASLAALVAARSVSVVLANDWAFEENFNSDPVSPSQLDLPALDYVVTHRTHPRDHLSAETLTFPADHGDNCSGPPNQHIVSSSHLSNAENPDESFYVCKNHMMSSLGEVSGYSVSSFFPRQSFYFADNGVLEFETNMDVDHSRFWWEVMIVPRHLLKVGAAEDWLPIDETYASDSIVFSLQENGQRKIQYHRGAVPPGGIVFSETDWRDWRFVNNEVPSDDPQFLDRRRRHLHRIEFAEDKITWSIEKLDGGMDAFEVNLEEPLAFQQGLVLFKTHSYTPTKDGNLARYTVHWDEIRFSGPVVGQYQAIESGELVYLQANGSRPIGDSANQLIEIPDTSVLANSPILFGQIHNPVIGQVLLSINGQPPIAVSPYEYEDGCNSSGWKSFQLPVDGVNFHQGSNTLTWTVGPRPSCLESWEWDGFSIKGLELQYDLDAETKIEPTKIPIPAAAIFISLALGASIGMRRLGALSR